MTSPAVNYIEQSHVTPTFQSIKPFYPNTFTVIVCAERLENNQTLNHPGVNSLLLMESRVLLSFPRGSTIIKNKVLY